MSTTALQGLLEYLYGTLTPNNMRWVADHLIEHANQLDEPSPKPYTMDEINAMLDQAEANFAAGKGIPDEEAWHEYDEVLNQEKTEMAEAI